MLKSIFSLGLCLLIPFLIDCAGSSSGGSTPSHTYIANVGTATSFDVNEKTRRLIDKHQYVVFRYEQSQDMIYFETEWKERAPFQDEQDSGILQARTRFILEARPRIRVEVAGSSDLNNVRLIFENMVLFESSPDWQYVPMTAMCKSYVRRIADDLNTDFRTGFRRF
ncbi:hypothetical protein L0337_15495 [candidate division KSB1 bacterium]|nr:hypothetical protein [candidate division KSB1 bacterium]